jgi:Co/Zn/Cd efflux system component
MWLANAALFKGIALAVLRIWVLGSTISRVFVTGVPEAFIMGSVRLLALAANVVSVLILMRFRSGDANVEPVWLCSRHDAIGNVAVVLAAIGVFATSATSWPDLAVAAIMASLFLSSSYKIVKTATKERSRLRGR